MANICPVCDKGIGAAYKEEIQGVSIHSYCEPIFLSEPEKFPPCYFLKKIEGFVPHLKNSG